MKTKSSEKNPDYLKKIANAKGIPGRKLDRKKARKILSSEQVEEIRPQPTKKESAGKGAENRKKKKEEKLRKELLKKLDEVDVTLKAADKMIDDAEERKRLGQFP